MSLSPAVRPYDALLIDLDGCLWVGDEATMLAPEALAALREAGKSVAFVTNDPRHHVEEYVRKLWRLGFQASVGEVVTVGAALQHHLAERSSGATAFVVGSTALVDHVADAGLRIANNTPHAAEADVVVVAGHDDMRFVELKVAVQAVLSGALLVGTARDRTFPMPDGPWPGSGAILAAVETAVGRTADVVIGKPEPALYETALERVDGERVLVVGDRLDSDMAGAASLGLDGALVLTGATSPQQAQDADPAPRHVADSFAALILGRDGG